jgi:hypothetical protein
MPPTLHLALTLPLSLMLGLGAMTTPSRAKDPQECRTIESVQKSAPEAAKNTAEGGHLAGHIQGAPAPAANWDYTNKTQFTSSQEFTGAWRNYLKATVSRLHCSDTTHGHIQAVPVQTLLKKDKIGAISCKDATCTAKNRTQMPKISFAFAFVNKKWILVTAYPSN